MEQAGNTSDWQILCRNPKCKHRYFIPDDCPVQWKVRKFRGVCGHGEDTIYPELKKTVKCPECGEYSYKLIPKDFRIKKRDECSI